MAMKNPSPPSEGIDSPISPSSSTEEYGDSYSDNMHSLMTNSYGDISGDESMFDRLLSDNETTENIFDEEMEAPLIPPSCSVIPEAGHSSISEMVKKSASNLTEELDSLVRQAYMESNDVHELAYEAKEEDEIDNKNSSVKFEKNQSLKLSELKGVLTREGDMVSFVADDLTEKIRLSSPSAQKSYASPASGSRSSTPNLYKQALSSQLPVINPSIINELETYAHKVASTVDNMLENLTGTLQSMSSLTVDCMDVYKSSVCKTCDVVDGNIKLMYQLMAKCEEINKSMSPIYLLAHQTKEIRRVLDLFESLVNSEK